MATITLVHKSEDGWMFIRQTGPCILGTKRCRATARSLKLMRKYAVRPSTVSFWCKTDNGQVPIIRISPRTGAWTVYASRALAVGETIIISHIQQEFNK